MVSAVSESVIIGSNRGILGFKVDINSAIIVSHPCLCAGSRIVCRTVSTEYRSDVILYGIIILTLALITVYNVIYAASSVFTKLTSSKYILFTSESSKSSVR